ncbi:hypothetical protein HGRIS_014499 [Hohenbuehelia grisea]|uniref:Uncharacterized protein n=1 Tax=Hohenbuehelia grisea TaxID=104357 RepID=A0ABR3JTT3_9AGAR
MSSTYAAVHTCHAHNIARDLHTLGRKRTQVLDAPKRKATQVVDAPERKSDASRRTAYASQRNLTLTQRLTQPISCFAATSRSHDAKSTFDMYLYFVIPTRTIYLRIH